MKRREMVALLAATPFVGRLGLDPNAVLRAARRAGQLPAGSYEPKFFTPHEWETVRTLVDLVIPKDERSGSATDALVPEFMDFILIENPDEQLWMRGGLAWLDTACRERFTKDFQDCDPTQRAGVLDDIAWPAKAKPDVSQGVAFFNRFRDFTASGFFSSEIGVKDLRYQGNVYVMAWNGCPPAQLQKLGVNYK